MKKLVLLGLSVGLFISVCAPAVASAHNTPSADKTPPKLTYLHIQSNNANPAFAKPGNTVTISLTANEKVTPIVLVETRTLFVRSTNSSGNSWDATYTVDPKDPQGKIDYLITLADTAGNVYICTSLLLPYQIIPRCLTTDGSSVTVDKTAPVIAAHANVFAVGTASGATVSYQNPTASDNIDTSVPVICAPASGSVFAVGTTTVTCNAKDATGNSAAPTTFKVIVSAPVAPSDTQAPVIAAHADVVATTTGISAAVSYTNPSASDNVDASVAVVCSPASGSSFAVGTTTIICNARDTAGNNATSTMFNVVVAHIDPAPTLIYEYWPTTNGGDGSGLTFASMNGTVYNPLISVRFAVATKITSLCLAIDSYNATDPTVALGIYEMPTPTSAGALLATSNPYSFAGQYVDWYISGDVTCTTFPAPVTLAANTQYAIGVDRTHNTTANEDIIWYNRDNINDPNVLFGSASSFPGIVIPTDDKPYIRIYGIQ